MARKNRAVKPNQASRQNQNNDNRRNKLASSEQPRPSCNVPLVDIPVEPDWCEFKSERLRQFAIFLTNIGQHEISKETVKAANAIEEVEAKTKGAQLPSISGDLSGLWAVIDMHADLSAVDAQSFRMNARSVDQILLVSAIDTYEQQHFKKVKKRPA
jgi:hypothetical protein